MTVVFIDKSKFLATTINLVGLLSLEDKFFFALQANLYLCRLTACDADASSLKYRRIPIPVNSS
jgi:hypothetical protein